MLIILVTVIFLEILLINGIKDHYYKNVEDILTSQIEFSTNFYARYFSTENLEETIIDDVDLFWQHTSAQVQVLSTDGTVLMDSLGVPFSELIATPDITDAMEKGKGVWSGSVSYDSDPVMAVSMPLLYRNTPVGILRFVSSLKATNAVITDIARFLVIMGFAVVAVAIIISIFIANSIVKPLAEVTEVANKMADGQFKVRSNVKYDDEIGKLSHTLNYMAEEILRKETLKNDFISSISHELRTPLTSIKGWAVTLKADEELSRDIYLDGLDIIENESDRLSRMVEELLDFSRFTSGRITLTKEMVDIKESLKMVVYQMMPRAINNNISFEVDIDDNLSPIMGDGNRIKQVLINVIDNAFKFTGKGKVTLKAYESENHLIIEVEDDGPGIPEEELPYIKEKFYKGKNSKSHSGIGLSICDEIMHLHEGYFNIESVLGEGTKVELGFPREASV
jgi:signal transduction histidine kinase